MYLESLRPAMAIRLRKSDRFRAELGLSDWRDPPENGCQGCHDGL